MQQFLFSVSIILVPGLVAITFHEVAHGFVADRLGDQTARYMGRLTLNPLRHLDLVGTLLLIFIRFGWAKPVPVNFGNLRKPKRDMIWVAVAGPLTNFALAALSAAFLRGIAYLGTVHVGQAAAMFLEPIYLMAAFSVYINLLLGLFNLIPVPPLDGGRVAVGLLPYRQAVTYSRIEPYGFFIVLFLVFFTPVFRIVILPLMAWGIDILAGPESGSVIRTINYLASVPDLFDMIGNMFR